MNLNSSLNWQSSSISLLSGSEWAPKVVNSKDSVLAMVPLETERAGVRVAGFPWPPSPNLGKESREWGGQWLRHK